jgi:hypothetical protein
MLDKFKIHSLPETIASVVILKEHSIIRDRSLPLLPSFLNSNNKMLLICRASTS